MSRAVAAPAFPLPPGPRGLPVVGVAPLYLRDLYEYPRRVAARYGDVVRLPVPGTSLILISHPDQVEHVFVRHADRYWKGEMNARLIDGMKARGIDAVPMPVADGAGWMRMRRAVAPLFGHRHLKDVSALMSEAVHDRVASWERHVVSGQRVDFDGELSMLTMDVLMRAMFSERLDVATLARAADAFRTFARASAVRMATWWAPRWLPRPYGRRGRQAEDWIYAYGDRVINERRTRPTDSPDLLNALLAIRFDDGAELSHDEIGAELAGFVFGGHETTSAALSWTLALLDTHPDARARAYAEVDALDGRRVEYADLTALPFLRACFDEAQRIQGGPLYARSPLDDDEIGGFRIPKGSIVIVSPYALHRDPRFWREPDRFRPERFLPDARDPITKFAYLPFNVGARRCVGMHFANIEAVLALAATLQRYRLRFPPGFTPRHEFHVSTGLRGGTPVVLERR